MIRVRSVKWFFLWGSSHFVNRSSKTSLSHHGRHRARNTNCCNMWKQMIPLNMTLIHINPLFLKFSFTACSIAIMNDYCILYCGCHQLEVKLVFCKSKRRLEQVFPAHYLQTSQQVKNTASHINMHKGSYMFTVTGPRLST